MSVAQRIDWFRVLDDLKRAGKSLYDVEAQAGIPKSNLIRYKEGQEPKHCEGEMLIRYWMEITGKHTNDRPIISAPLSAAAVK